MHRTKAFTLSELLMVVVIMAVGTAAAIPILGKGQENQKMKAVQTSVRYLRDRVILYAKDRGDGLLPVTGTNGSDFSKLFDTQYLVPDDLPFYKNDNSGIVANYFFISKITGNNINLPPGAAAKTPLFKVCGTFNPTLDSTNWSGRFFCIYQCANGGHESTEKDSASVRDTCPS